MPESAIRFGSFEAAKRALAQLEGHGDAKSLSPSSKFLAGGLGGMASQYVSVVHLTEIVTNFHADLLSIPSTR